MFLWAVTQIYNGKKGSRPGFLRLYTPRSALFNFQGSRRLRCTVFKVCKSGRCLIFKVRFFRCSFFKIFFFCCSSFKVHFYSLFIFQGLLYFVVWLSRFTFCFVFQASKNQRTGSGKLSVLRFVGCERERYGPYMIMGWVPDYPFLGMLIR